MKIKCIDNGEGDLNLTVGEIYDLINETYYNYEIVNDYAELVTYTKQCFEKIIDDKEVKSNTRNDGLTEGEGVVMDSLVDAYNKFVKLKTTHPSEKDDFIDGIHECQQVLMNRVLRRDYPLGFPSYPKENK